MIKRIKENLNLKVFLGVFFLLICSSAIIYSIVFISLPDSYKTTKEAEIHIDMDDIKRKINGQSYEVAKNVLYDYTRKNGYDIALEDGYGEVIYYSYTDSDRRSATVDPDNLLVSIVNEGSAVVYSNVFLTDEVGPCVLYIYGYGETINSISHILLGYLPLILTVIILLATAGAFLAAKLITRPIRKLSRDSQRMATMDLEISCELSRNDELGVLSRNLDHMYRKLMQTLYELAARSEQLQEEIKKEKIAEQKRKDFFAAVSHELKTPITILKGELEGMIHNYGDYKDRDHYLAHTLDITNEIDAMVKEILMISKMSSDSMNYEFAEVNLTDLIYDTYENFIPLANMKKIDILCDLDEDILATVDEASFKKVISNLIGNAVKYSPEGEEVRITLTEERLCVENTGVHINENDLSNVFEPFYRVEQSRNRMTGGTGLGLYIVKTILELHHLAYEMTNSENGVLFIIYLSQRQE